MSGPKLPIYRPMIRREYNGHPIKQRLTDGYLSANDLCKAMGVSLDSDIIHKPCMDFINMMMKSLLIERDINGVWFHPSLVEYLLRYLKYDLLRTCAYRWDGEYKLLNRSIKNRYLGIVPPPPGPNIIDTLPNEVTCYIIHLTLEAIDIARIKCFILNKHIWQLAKSVWISMVRARLIIVPATTNISQIFTPVPGATLIHYLRLTAIKIIHHYYRFHTVDEPVPYTIFNMELVMGEVHVTVCGYTIHFIRINDGYVPISHTHSGPNEYEKAKRWAREHGKDTIIVQHVKYIITTILPELLDTFDFEP